MKQTNKKEYTENKARSSLDFEMKFIENVLICSRFHNPAVTPGVNNSLRPPSASNCAATQSRATAGHTLWAACSQRSRRSGKWKQGHKLKSFHSTETEASGIRFHD